jgi:hypothetical protein
MVTISYIKLVGNFEDLDVTLAYQTTQKWPAESTGLIVDTDIFIKSATGSNVPYSWDDITAVGLNQIHFNEIKETIDETNCNVGDTYDSFISLIMVDVFAADAQTLKKIIRAINNIIWKIDPNGVGSQTVLKSNGTEASHIGNFSPAYIDFNNDPLNSSNAQAKDKVHASGILKVRFFKTKG